MRLGLSYDLQTDPADERQVEFDSPATLSAVRGALEALGHEVVPLGCAEDLLSEPDRLKGVEVVFNLAEGRAGRCREAWVPVLLELHGVPYVGSDSLALALGLDKVVCKRLAASAGVATPRWLSIVDLTRLPETIPLTFPLIVKPRHEGSGRGIGAGAVVFTREALAQRVEWLFERCRQPLVIEEFIGRGVRLQLRSRIDRHSERAFPHGAFEELSHLFYFVFFCRPLVVGAHDLPPHGAMSGQSDDVHGRW